MLPEYEKTHMPKTKEESAEIKMNIQRLQIGGSNEHHLTSIVAICEQEVSIDPKDGNEDKKNFIDNLQYRLVGPYLCYRTYSDAKIRIRNVLDPYATEEERCIDLKSIAINSEEKKYITFEKIRAASFQTMNGESSYFVNLLEVVTQNSVYIFNLDSKGDHPQEVNFIDGVD